MRCPRPSRRPLRGLLRTRRRWALGDHAHDVGLLHDQEFLAVELDLCARPLAEQHAVACFQVDRNELAVLVAAAGADRNDFTFLRLLLGGIRDDDPAFGFLFGGDPSYDNSIVKGTKLGFGHGLPLGAKARLMNRKFRYVSSLAL